jgi:hypothetical protein
LNASVEDVEANEKVRWIFKAEGAETQDKLSADFARLTELLLAKRKRVG